MIKYSTFDTQEARTQFQVSAHKPFSHAVLNNLISQSDFDACAEEFLKLGPEHMLPYHSEGFEFDKFVLNKREHMPEKLGALFDEMHSDEFISALERTTGFTDLKCDQLRWGGGLHLTKPGGYLAVHKDFSVLPSTFGDAKQYLRVLNVIGYLTPDWEPGFGGELELWNDAGSECVKTLEPRANRWVIFDTREKFHGHPWPYKGKAPRISVAAYYYQELEVPRDAWHSTVYLKLPWREDSEEYARARRERADASRRYAKFMPQLDLSGASFAVK